MGGGSTRAPHLGLDLSPQQAAQRKPRVTPLPQSQPARTTRGPQSRGPRSCGLPETRSAVRPAWRRSRYRATSTRPRRAACRGRWTPKTSRGESTAEFCCIPSMHSIADRTVLYANQFIGHNSLHHLSCGDKWWQMPGSRADTMRTRNDRSPTDRPGAAAGRVSDDMSSTVALSAGWWRHRVWWARAKSASTSGASLEPPPSNAVAGAPRNSLRTGLGSVANPFCADPEVKTVLPSQPTLPLIFMRKAHTLFSPFC